MAKDKGKGKDKDMKKKKKKDQKKDKQWVNCHHLQFHTDHAPGQASLPWGLFSCFRLYIIHNKTLVVVGCARPTLQLWLALASQKPLVCGLFFLFFAI